MGYRYLTICDLSQFCRAFFHEDHFSSLAIPHCLHASIHFLTRLLLWVLLQAHHFSHVFLHSISRPLLVYFSLSTLLFLISQRKSHSSSKFFFASCIYDNPAHIFLCAVCFCFPDFCKLFGSQFPAFGHVLHVRSNKLYCKNKLQCIALSFTRIAIHFHCIIHIAIHFNCISLYCNTILLYSVFMAIGNVMLIIK